MSCQTKTNQPKSIESDKVTHEAEHFSQVDHSSSDYVYGIDISHHQNDEVDFIVQHKDSIQFVFCKATEGLTFIDPKFNKNWSTLKEHGVLRGAYHFFKSKDDPKKQATFFLNTISTSEKTDIPPVLDFEEGGIDPSQSVNQVQADVKVFLEEIENKLGCTPIIYTDVRTANKYLDDPHFSNYPLWIANYIKGSAPHLPRTWKDKGWVFWQKTSTYQLDGQNNDLDIFDGSYKNLKSFIKNSYPEN